MKQYIIKLCVYENIDLPKGLGSIWEDFIEKNISGADVVTSEIQKSLRDRGWNADATLVQYKNNS